VDETGGTGQERQVGWSIGFGGGGLRNSGRASGGAEGTQELRAPVLIEDVFEDGFGFGGIELRSLIEVVGAGFRDAIFFLLPIAVILGGLFAFLFVVAVKRGQFDDLDDPPQRILKDD